MLKRAEKQQDVTVPMLLRAARLTYAEAIREELISAGLSDLPRNGTFVIRAIEHSSEPLSDIARDLSVSKQAASKLIDLLVVRGFLVRTADADRPAPHHLGAHRPRPSRRRGCRGGNEPRRQGLGCGAVADPARRLPRRPYGSAQSVRTVQDRARGLTASAEVIARIALDCTTRASAVIAAPQQIRVSRAGGPGCVPAPCR